MDRTSFEVIGILTLIILLPLVTVCTMLYVGWMYGGLLGWICGALILTPIIVYWYLRISQRIKNYLALLQTQSHPFHWNVDETVNDFMNLLKKQRKKKR
ncbi:MAG: hypothetical protein OEY81_02570 [Candidatus Bathyarchaeota archaeon]|nr:hypothetical protein [Candidatus Bathyarchaeota archaeon]